MAEQSGHDGEGERSVQNASGLVSGTLRVIVKTDEDLQGLKYLPRTRS